MDLDKPIVIVGRGGSGTRLLSDLMQSINVFIGNQVNKTGDSVEWVDPIYDLVINEISIENGNFTGEHAKKLMSNAAETVLKSGRQDLDLWGWKLPETMLCVPEVFNAFSGARLIHLVRNPISLSLRRTHMTSRTDNPVGQTVLRLAYNKLNKEHIDLDAQPEYINNAVSWDYQVSRVLDFAEKHLTTEQYLLIRYEDICETPQIVLDKICSFLKIQKMETTNLSIDVSRTKQYMHTDPRIEKVWQFCSETAVQLNYLKE